MGIFNGIHIKYLLISLVITVLFLVLAYPFNKKKYAKFLGIIILLIKAIDIFIRIYIEKTSVAGVQETAVNALPFHLCNIAIILAGIYLLTENKYLYGIIYSWMYGAFLVMLLPSNFTFITKTYPVLFFLTHTMIIVAVIYGRKYFRHRMNYKMLILSLFAYILASVNAYFVNINLGTNFFYLNGYILPIFAKMFSLNMYRIVFLFLNLSAITLLFLLDRKFIKDETPVTKKN